MNDAALPPEPDLSRDPPVDPQLYIQQLKDCIRLLREQNAVLRAQVAELQRRDLAAILLRS